ncbi:MAG: CPBP family intramembrane metalloprotease [Deltaproteobacteria bacterium]
MFLFLIAPSLALSFFVISQGNVGFMLAAVMTILRDLSLVSLILFFLWRNKESVLRIGWTLQGFEKEVLVGLVLWLPMMLGTSALEKGAEAIGFSVRSTPLPALEPSKTILDMSVAVVLVTIVAFAEETIFRGYLMLRFEAIFRSSLWSVVISAFVFSLGHGYEGTAGVITAGAMGLILGVSWSCRFLGGNKFE